MILSPEDVSIPGVIACDRITVDDWIAQGLKLAEEAAHILGWLRSR